MSTEILTIQSDQWTNVFRDGLYFNSVVACEVHLLPTKGKVLYTYIYSLLWSLENMWNGQNCLFCQLHSVVY